MRIFCREETLEKATVKTTVGERRQVEKKDEKKKTETKTKTKKTYYKK